MWFMATSFYFKSEMAYSRLILSLQKNKSYILAHLEVLRLNCSSVFSLFVWF